MLEKFTTKYPDVSGDIVKQQTLIYLSVGSKIVDSSYSIPDSVKDATNIILSAIYNETSIFEILESGNFNTPQTTRFIDDFSMFRPRGHYTTSPELETYFRLFKWFSRIPFFFDNYFGESKLNTTPEDMIKSSLYLIYLMKETQISIPGLGITGSGLDIWTGFKTFLDKLVGKTYMMTPENIDTSAKLIKSSDWTPESFSNAEITQLQMTILSNYSIPHPEDPFIIDAINFHHRDITASNKN